MSTNDMNMLLTPGRRTPGSRTGTDDELGQESSSNKAGEKKRATVSSLSTDLTVGKKSKVEQELHKYEEASHAPSPWLTVSKWFVGVLISLTFTFSLVFSKIGVIYLGHDLQLNESFFSDAVSVQSVDISAEESRESTIAMLILVVLVPPMTTFLRSLWSGGFSKDRPWPTLPAFFVGVICSILESFGLSLFVLVVIPSVPHSVGVLLMNGVFLAHACYMLIKTIFQTELSPAGRLCLIVSLSLAVLLSAAGIILTIFCFSCPRYLRMGAAVWAIPVSLLCLSVAWCNPLQRLQLLPSMSQRLKEDIKLLAERHDLGEGAGSVQVAHGTKSEPNMWTLVTAYPIISARWKLSVMTSALKMLLLPGFMVLLTYSFHEDVDLSQLHLAFVDITPAHPLFPYFLTSLICSAVGSLLGWLACTLSMQRLSFGLPLTLATPIAFFLVLYLESCGYDIFSGTSSTAQCIFELKNLIFVVPSAVCLYLAQILSTGYYVFKGQSLILEKESQMFWLPGYNGVLMEQHLLLGRKTKQTDHTLASRLHKAQSSRVFICTTMYREAAHEMKQLLRSLGRINRAKQQSDRHFQAHIFFDNGVRHNRLTQFALQLVVVAGTTLALRLKDCRKIETPYGLQLRWMLPTVFKGKKGMELVIHLKDNLKVKNKKRWSQVMYMSYVLDYHIKIDRDATDNNTLILTTDADVDFTPASVEALLDLMTRDDKVGAVCARTFPLGSGPVVWYQIFDYAIGHWFQKAANHVLGTVLCCPGCFSVYRAEALRHVLPTYASHVTKASEFLTKDMGEDRWLCTLLVQSGWRLEYSAAADNHTFCPEEFDEFFKQRRRWVPSTLANLALLLQEWKTVYYFNRRISLLFLMYQAALLFSTLISPAVSMLVITGGLYYAWGVSQYVSMALLYLTTISYIAVCLMGSPDLQLKVAKVLTVLFAFVMAAVTVGTIVQIAEETETVANATIPTAATSIAQFSLPVATSTIYLCGLVVMFLLSGLLHLPEMYCLFHAIWYLWCLPAGFILLLTYSVVNLTDRSWGTREEKKDPKTSINDNKPGIFNKLQRFLPFGKRDDHDDGAELEAKDSLAEDEESDNENKPEQAPAPAIRMAQRKWKGFKKSRRATERIQSFRFHYKDAAFNDCAVSQWLPGTLRDQYASLFEDAGYDDTSFLVGISEGELLDLGVKVKAHRQALLAEIRTLGDPEIEPFVPDTIEEWLTVIRLQEYFNNFRRMHIVSGKQLEILKNMSPEDIKSELGITKPGHLKRLLLAINKLRYPTESEMRQGQVKVKLEQLPTRQLSDLESTFWTNLRHEKLLPTSTAFSDDYELKEKLTDLRNSTLVVFGVTNTIWIILILTLAPKSQLNVLGTNLLGLAFLVIFGLVITIQFICMIIHRLSTFIHLIARAPPCCGDPYHINWSFADSNFRPPASVRRRTHIFEETLEDLRISREIQRCSTISDEAEQAV